ncbi:hypothetical protein [Caulobacter sp. BP25]|uniref:hypothetical protein n=1 Tax=Caulobacter sp. BP25 TaxID=2048900 RepID=UPI000C12B534|nr:hypothetical protein [Caulobacter sp. BP25]PHY20819.1 hypothetical protein CSW59_06235 [Caulobacter sp. BP25]
MAQTVTLVEVDVTSPAGVTSTLRFSDRAIRPLPPSEPIYSNVPWDDRLIDPPTLRRSLFDDMATLTPALGVGSMSLSNGDGGLDAYRGHLWRTIRIWRWTEGQPFSTASRLLSGLATPPEYDDSTSSSASVSVSLYDYSVELDRDIQPTVYSGGNGTGGVLYEGAADGLKGRPKPLGFGRLTDAHIPAPQVNAAVLAYQLHDAAISGGVQIFDRGSPAGYAAQPDRAGSVFDAYTPPAAGSVTDLGRGLLKINGDPVGKLTFGFQGESAGGYVETVGPILARILARAGVPADRIGASIGALSAPAPVGLWVGDTTSAAAIVAKLARSAGAAVLPDRQGVWQAFKFAAPAASPAFEIGADQVVRLSADNAGVAPAGVVRIGWGQVYTTFTTSELLPALVKTTTAERLATEYRYAVAEDATVKSRLPTTWRTIEIDTALRLEADAQALANDLRALFGLRADGAPRRQWKVVLEMTPEALAMSLGATVRLVYPPRGIDGLYLLVGEEPMRPSRDLMTWTLWG